MIRQPAALALARDLAPEAGDTLIHLMASLIVVRVQNDELKQAEEAQIALGSQQ